VLVRQSVDIGMLAPTRWVAGVGRAVLPVVAVHGSPSLAHAVATDRSNRAEDVAGACPVRVRAGPGGGIRADVVGAGVGVVAFEGGEERRAGAIDTLASVVAPIPAVA